MTGAMLTTKQRDVLRHRLSRELCWAEVPAGYRNDAIRLANIVLDELEHSGFTAGTQRRAVEKIVASLDDATPLRSVSPAKRDAPPVADATELGSGVAS